MTQQCRIILFIILAMIWSVWIINRHFDGPHIDISALFMAGWLAGDGQADLIYLAPSRVFNAEAVPVWQKVMAAQGVPDQIVTAYLYPPIWAKLLSWPAHALGATAFFKAAYIWHMAAALLSAVLAFLMLRISARPNPLAWGVTLIALLFVTSPAANSFLNNQPQLTTNLLILLAFFLVSRGQSIGGGALLGLAAALKVSPILFTLIFILRRDWPAFFATLAVSGGIAALSIAVMGWPLHAEFLARLSEINALIVMTKINYAPEALIYQTAEWLWGAPMPDGRKLATFIAAEPLWITVTIKLTLLAALAAFVTCTRRLARANALPVQLLLLSLITALFGPFSWAHYFFLPMLLLPALFTIMSPKRAWGWIVSALALNSLASFALLHPLNHHFMLTALVPALFFLALLADAMRAAHHSSQQHTNRA